MKQLREFQIREGKQHDWEMYVEKNDDPYGGRIIEYAATWAYLMEERMRAGETLEQCAGSSSRVADYDYITGFMFGAAVVTLADVWEHGDALRRWHNLRIQIRDEGERANAEGATLNPALVMMRRDEK